jgi:hypothetical protein
MYVSLNYQTFPRKASVAGNPQGLPQSRYTVALAPDVAENGPYVPDGLVQGFRHI